MDREPHSLNVLVADATAVGRQLAAFLFGKRGHTVRAVATAADLLASLDPPPDLVVVLYDRQHILLQEARTMLHSLLGVSTRIVEAAGVMLEGIARVRGEGQ